MRLPINIANLAIWPMTTEETATSAAVYGTKIDYVNRFMSFSDTPKQQEGGVSGDGNVTNKYFAKDGGELSLNIQRLIAAERVALFDETQEADGTTSMGKADTIPYCGVAFTVENDDGTIDLYKYPKVKLIEQTTSVEQKAENGIKYSTMSLKGGYLFDQKNGKARYINEDLSPATNAAEITAWYAKAEYVSFITD